MSSSEDNDANLWPSYDRLWDYVASAAKLAHLLEDCHKWPDSAQSSLKSLLRIAIVEGRRDQIGHNMTTVFHKLIEEHSRKEWQGGIAWFLERSSFGARLMSKFPELACDVAEAIVAHTESCKSWCCDQDFKRFVVRDGSIEDFIGMLVEYHSSMEHGLASGRISPGASARFKEEVVKELCSLELRARLMAQYSEFISDVADLVFCYVIDRASWPQTLKEWLTALMANGCGLEEIIAANLEYLSTVHSGSYLNQILSRTSTEFKNRVIEVLVAPGLRCKMMVMFPEACTGEHKKDKSWTCTECGFECPSTLLVCDSCDTRRGKGNVAVAQGRNLSIFDQHEFKLSSAAMELRATMPAAPPTNGHGAGCVSKMLSEGKARPDLHETMSPNISFSGAQIATRSARIQSHSVSPFALVAYLPIGMEVTSSALCFSPEEFHQDWVQLMHPVPGWIRGMDLRPLCVPETSLSKMSPNAEMFALMHQTRQWIGPSPRHKCIVSTRRLLDDLLLREQSGCLVQRLGHGLCEQVHGSFLAEETRRPWWPPAYECWVPHTFLAFTDGSIADLTADQWNLEAPQLWWPADSRRYRWSPEAAHEASAIRYSMGKDRWQQLEELDHVLGVWRTRRKWKEIEKAPCKHAASPEAWQFSFQRIADAPHDCLRLQDVVLAAWVTGGYLPEQSKSMLADLMEFAREHGVHDTVFCDHPGGYPITGSGHGPYPEYIDTLITEIDKEPRRLGRPLVLFAQGWGAPHALALATRLGSRVLKVYIVARGPLWVGGLPSYWDELSQELKREGGNSLLEYLRDWHPGNMLFERACSANALELKRMFDESPFLTRTINHAQMAFVDGIYPDMSRDVRILSCPLCVITALLDPITPEDNISWILWTTGDYQAMSIDGGHYGCLRPSKRKGKVIHFPLGDLLMEDMLNCLQNIRWMHLRSRTALYSTHGVA